MLVRYKLPAAAVRPSWNRTVQARFSARKARQSGAHCALQAEHLHVRELVGLVARVRVLRGLLVAHWALPGDAHEERTAEAPHIHCWRVWAALDYLWRQVPCTALRSCVHKLQMAGSNQYLQAEMYASSAH